MTGVDPQNLIATAVAIDDAGSGYTVGNTLTVTGGTGTIPVELTVSTVNMSGGITGVSISNVGLYRVVPANPVLVTGGSGSGAEFNLTFIEPYKMWVHEVGTDEVDGQNLQPIRSFFETADLSLPATSQINRALQVLMVEPDFVQSGDMTLQVVGRANARAQEVYGPLMTFPDVATTPQEQVVFLKEQRRELRFRFESNALGGDYQMGTILAHVQQGDGTTIG